MAITGKGSFPFRSSWNRKNTQYRKNFIFGDRDHIEVTIWSNWFFAGEEAEIFYQIISGNLDFTENLINKIFISLLGTLTPIGNEVEKGTFKVKVGTVDVDYTKKGRAY